MDYVNSGRLKQPETWPYPQPHSFRVFPIALCQASSHREVWSVSPFGTALRAALPQPKPQEEEGRYMIPKIGLVHLFAGSKPHKPLLKLESNGTVVLELDIERSQAQNLYNDAFVVIAHSRRPGGPDLQP